MLAWDSETGEPLSPIVVWQDKRSQEILDELTDREDEVKELSGLPFDPYFSAAKLAWLLEHNDDVKKARDDGQAAHGDGRLVPLRPARRRLRHRTRHRLAHPAAADRQARGLRRAPLRDLRRADRGAAGDPRHGRATSARCAMTAGRWSCRFRGQVVDQQAALAGAACVEPGRVKATYGTGVFVLAHVGDGVPEPAGGLLPTVAWSIDGKLEYALDGGVFAAGAMLEWMCHQLGIAEDPPALSKLAREAESSAGARVLPALAGIGAPWWRPNARAVIAGIYGGTTRENVARAALEGIAWRVADVVAAIRETRAGRRAARRRRAHQRAAACSSCRPTPSARRSRRPAPTPRCSARRRSPASARA